MNILILSSGTRNKLVRYFKQELEGVGRVIAADMSLLAPSLYEADSWYQVPRISDQGYIDFVLSICKKEGVGGVLSLIDPELSLLAENADSFVAAGTRVIGSSYEACELSFNKMKMFHWLDSHGYRCAKSYPSFESFEKGWRAGGIDFPVFVKPICGSASISIGRVDGINQLQSRFELEADLMAQEYLPGQEIGVDAYVDMISGEVVSIFAKKKIAMRAGETDKALSFKDERLFSLVERLLIEGGFRGPVDIDLFYEDGMYYVSEVNPRFGGGYPFAHECGCNHVACIIGNLQGRKNRRCIGEYSDGVAMMKYCDVTRSDGDSSLEVPMTDRGSYA